MVQETPCYSFAASSYFEFWDLVFSNFLIAVRLMKFAEIFRSVLFVRDRFAVAALLSCLIATPCHSHEPTLFRYLIVLHFWLLVEKGAISKAYGRLKKVLNLFSSVN